MLPRFALLFFSLLALPAFAQNTVLVLDSEPGDSIGRGENHYFTQADGTFTAQRNFQNGVDVTFFNGSHDWHLSFAAPDHAPLAVQIYNDATAYPFQLPGEPGLRVRGNGLACDGLGAFEVKEIVYGAGDAIVSFHATFVQRCNTAAPPLLGEVLYFSNDPPPPLNHITSSLTAFATRNQPFQYQIKASNHPTGFTAPDLPAGLSLNASSGLISGTPAVEGKFSVLLGAIGASGTASGTLHLTINPPGQSTGAYTALFLTSDPGDSIAQGQSYYYRESDGNFGTSSLAPNYASVYFSATVDSWYTDFAAPTGTTMGIGTYLRAVEDVSPSNPRIHISGQGRACGSAAGAFEVKDFIRTNGRLVSYRGTFAQHCGGGVPALRGQVWFNAPRAITSHPRPLATRGQPFSYQIIGNNAPTSFTASALPAALSIDTVTGIISGTPDMGGKFSIPVTATGPSGTVEDRLTLVVAVPGEPTPAPVITSPSEAAGSVNQTFSYQITASNSPTQFSASGLPSGLVLDPNTGLISGESTVTGTFDVLISASNTSGAGGSSLTLTIYSPPPVITSANAASVVRWEPFSFQVTASNQPTGFSLDGQPSGLSLNATSGLLTGAPTQAGVFHIVFRATNGSGTTFQNFTLTVTDPVPTPTPPPGPGTLGNISTRLRVGLGDNALIGGFIITGTEPKRIIVRAIGPSLSIPGRLSDPILELRDSSGLLIAANDYWRTSQEWEITATGLAPPNSLEPAILVLLAANNTAYTAIVRPANFTTGIGLVEVYDLDQSADSMLGNISTRGLVQTNDNVLIAGTIVVGQNSRRVLVRALGPSLSLAGKLEDPILALHDANGALLRTNDNWRTDQEAEIIATTIPPPNDLESAILHTLSGNGAAYTAIVRGVNNTTGVAVVEVYALP